MRHWPHHLPTALTGVDGRAKLPLSRIPAARTAPIPAASQIRRQSLTAQTSVRWLGRGLTLPGPHPSVHSIPEKFNTIRELLGPEQTRCIGSSRCSSVCRLARIEWPNRGPPATPARRSSRVISVRRFEFFQPIAVLAAARYCGAATTYSLLSPKISNASSRISQSSA